MITKNRNGVYADFMAHADELVVQPRMGFSDFESMREGLERVRDFDGSAIGTLTIDSFTRRNMLREAAEAVRKGKTLNGWPICTHPLETSRDLLAGIRESGCPVQVRHGSALPQHVFRAAADLEIDAIEGGPVSYCLPYSRVPLAESFDAWDEAVRMWADFGWQAGLPVHLESFGGCMLGQLCPPSLLIAITLLEGRFFVERGIRSLSLSLAQGTNADQDVGALLALRRIAADWFADCDWHIVFYTYMGMFPETKTGARRLIEESAALAVIGGARRLIVKTAVEAFGIPTIDDNLTAMAWSRDAARQAVGTKPTNGALAFADAIEAETRELLSSVLSGDDDLATAIVAAFADGTLDIPYCIHPGNRGAATTWIDPADGVIGFNDAGNMRVPTVAAGDAQPSLGSEAIMRGLTYMRQRYDGH